MQLAKHSPTLQASHPSAFRQSPQVVKLPQSTGTGVGGAGHPAGSVSPHSPIMLHPGGAQYPPSWNQAQLVLPSTNGVAVHPPHSVWAAQFRSLVSSDLAMSHSSSGVLSALNTVL